MSEKTRVENSVFQYFGPPTKTLKIEENSSHTFRAVGAGFANRTLTVIHSDAIYTYSSSITSYGGTVIPAILTVNALKICM